MEVRLSRARSKKGRKGRSGAGPRYWILGAGALGTIIAFTIGDSRAMNVAAGEFRGGRFVSSHLLKEDRLPETEFDIPAGPLSDVLAAFEKKTGISVKVDDPVLLSIGSPGVKGRMTPEKALATLLEGTGITYVFAGARNVDLRVAAENATVEISGSDARILSSPKYDAPLRDLPQTINVISKEVIEQQGATTLRDTLNNIPGITLTAGEGGAPAGDNLTIRGFSARNDIYVDGVRDLGPQSRDPFDLEQVEVVKGPSSAFTGRGSTGGTINLVSKLPNLRRSFAGTISGGTSGMKRATADINLPIGDTAAFRLNLMGHDSDFPGREVVQNRRWGAAPSIILGLGSKTRYAFSYFYTQQENTSDYGIPWVPANNNVLVEFRDRPAPVPRSTFYGYLDRDKENLRSDLFTARIEHDFNDRFSISNQFRYGYSRRDSIATPPRFASADSTQIKREMRSWLTNDDIFDDQVDARARFKTGAIEHSIVFGGAFSYEKNDRVLRSAPNAFTTLLDPDPNDVYPGVISIDPYRPHATANSAAGYIFDSIHLGKMWEITGGVRLDQFNVSGENTARVSGVTVFVPIERDDTLLSGRAAVVFKPTEFGSIYASFATSANPSLEGLLYQPADVNTDPERSHTIEVGSKWDLLSRRLMLAGALFRVQKTNARTPSLIAGEPPTLDGDQLVQGLELSATGNITRNWQLIGGYTFLDSEIVRSNTAAEVGKRITNTPEHSFSLWTTYTRDRLFFGGGPRYVSSRFGNNSNTRLVDGYFVVDAVVSYRLSKHFDVRANLYNIGDKFYIDRIGGGHIIPGAARSLVVSVGFNF